MIGVTENANKVFSFIKEQGGTPFITLNTPGEVVVRGEFDNGLTISCIDRGVAFEIAVWDQHDNWCTNLIGDDRNNGVLIWVNLDDTLEHVRTVSEIEF